MKPSPPFDGAARFALFLDIDGTLIGHKPHPDDVMADDALRTLLGDLFDALDGALALVTGRNVATADRVFAPLLLPAAGLYGLEHRLVRDGPVEAADEPEDMAAVADALMQKFHSEQGIYFERKGPVLAVHTRAAPHMLPEVRSAAEEALAALPQGYRIVVGHAGLEFLPVEALKSAAIERFMQGPPFHGRLPVFLGDDVSDEAGFQYVNSAGGISVRVRPEGATEANYLLDDVPSVHEWLATSLSRATHAGNARVRA